MPILVDWSQLGITTLMGELKGRTDIPIDISTCRNLWLRNLMEIKTRYGERFGDIIICVDGKDYWRRLVFPHYKCTRKKSKEDSGYDWEQIGNCLRQVQGEIEEFFPYKVVCHASAEADDVIAILVEWYQTNDLDVDGLFETPKDILIFSGDEDFCQLQKYPNVKQISPLTRKQVKPDIPLKEFNLYHILQGDGTDGVMSINSPPDFFYKKELNPDVKVRQPPVTAKMKKFYWEQYKHGEITEWLQPEHEKRFLRNEMLVILDKIPRSVHNKVIAVFTSLPDKDRSQVLNFLIQNRMNNLIANATDF